MSVKSHNDAKESTKWSFPAYECGIRRNPKENLIYAIDKRSVDKPK